MNVALSILSGMPYRRARRTSGEISDLKTAMLEIVSSHDNLTVRHLFYLMVSAGLVEKSEASYNNVVIRLALQLRRLGDIPYGKIVDGTRLYREPRLYDSMQQALNETARLYRRSYWTGADVQVEVWCEKEAISGFLYDVTAPLGVPLMVTRGFSSEGVVQDVAEAVKADGRPLKILFVSDLDPSGELMPADVLKRIKFYAPASDIELIRVAVDRDQVRRYGLPTRPTKRDGNRHAANFEGASVEVDAMPPGVLKHLLRTAIEEHMDLDQLRVLKAAEESERQQLAAFRIGGTA